MPAIIGKLRGAKRVGGQPEFSEDEISLLLDTLPTIKHDHVHEFAMVSPPEELVSGPLGVESELKVGLLHQRASADGHCFLWLMLMVKEFLSVSFSVFERCLDSLDGLYGESDSWPQVPLGKDVIVSLAALKLSLQGHPIDNHLSIPHHLLSRALEEITHSGVAYNFSESSGVIHLEGPTLTPCGCAEVLCNHGWSSRFIVTAVSGYGKRVGATIINLNDIFGTQETISDEDFSTAPLKVNSGFKVEHIRPVAPSGDFEESLEQTPIYRMEPDILQQRYEEVQKELEHAHFLNRQFSARTKLPDIEEEKNFKPVDPSPAADRSFDNLKPSDSSSNIGRYRSSDRQGYMGDGTVFTLRRPSLSGGGDETLVQYTPVLTPQVVQGFVHTERLVAMDKNSRSKVKPINGLCNPFKNNRLNFLLHFFSAMAILEDLWPEGATPFELLKRCGSLGGRTPTLELLVMVVERTFDCQNQIVCSNPFQLPYLEIGMLLSDDCVVKSLSLLEKEYEIVWFQEVKALRMPKFHRDHVRLSSEKISRSSRGPGRHGGSEGRRASSESGGKTRRSSSMFSFS